MELPIRAELREPCARLAPAAREELPALSTDRAIRDAQLAERRFFLPRETDLNGRQALACRQRDEVIGIVDENNAGAKR